MIEIEDFIHPGGENIIQEILGEEINYFLTGGHSTKGNPRRHTHTMYVWRYFNKKMSILLQMHELLHKR